jgi:hypothetical protein
MMAPLSVGAQHRPGRDGWQGAARPRGLEPLMAIKQQAFEGQMLNSLPGVDNRRVRKLNSMTDV